tara:strand:+ start:2037 stop:3047 length:1011 start_codon:yes stop_codon:yes gene_type:complete
MRSLKSVGRQVGLIGILTLAITACEKEVTVQDVLPSLGTSESVSVSGISSGGYMAGQFLVAFSERVSGAGIVAAGPWGCARGDINRALQKCISGTDTETEALQELAREKAEAGNISALANLEGARLLLFHGSEDAVVGAAAMDELVNWLAPFTDEEKIQYVTDIPAAHGWPTDSYGNDCGEFAAPFINSCEYDLAGEILSHIYSDLAPPATEVGAAQRFDQRPFGDANLADFGYVYVPESCANGTSCRVHIFFHGCEQSAATAGTELLENAGLNEWAESNDIVVLYPQVEKSLAAPMNPYGCWDWWGYTGEDYLERKGRQLSAVSGMIDTLAGTPD